MKLGIIIIFHNNEALINKQLFIEKINQSKSIELCLVDNNSTDKTLQLLTSIKEECSSNISVVEIKKHTSKDVAKRAGARFMFNQFNLKHIGFINADSTYQDEKHLSELIKQVYSNKDIIIDYNAKTISTYNIKPTLFKCIFSVVDYITKLKIIPAVHLD
ncbi:MAG: glycosyltransferase [Winogradskyella sp.]